MLRSWLILIIRRRSWPCWIHRMRVERIVAIPLPISALRIVVGRWSRVSTIILKVCHFLSGHIRIGCLWWLDSAQLRRWRASAWIRRRKVCSSTTNLTGWTNFDEARDKLFRYPCKGVSVRTLEKEKKNKGHFNSWPDTEEIILRPSHHEYIWRTWADVLSRPPCWHCWCARVNILNNFSRIATGFSSWHIHCFYQIG